MASQVKHFDRKNTRDQGLTPGLRFILILLIFCIQMIYVPTSNRIFGGIEPKLPIDIFPIWSVWVLPYILCYPLWIAAIVWAIFKMEDRLFRSFVAAFLLTCTISISIFIFFPTYVKPATFHDDDIFTVLLQFIHRNGGRYDAFPSGHVYITVLLALFYNIWYPRYRFYWILIPAMVAFSTLFTHQHFIVDVMGGLVVAVLGFHFGLRWAGFSPLPAHADKRHVLLPPP